MDSNKDIDMSINYLIEKRVVYSPSTNTLHSLIDDSQFTLLAAASECLLLLLINHGKLVSKTRLTYVGWEQYSLHVSDNTFYQNILIMRRGIKLCGINEEIIKTIPRKGLMIPDTVKVEMTPLVTQDIQSPDENLSVIDYKEESITSLVHKKYKKKYNINTYVLHSTTFAAFMLSSAFLSLPKDYISSYVNLDNKSECHIKIKKNIGSRDDFESFSSKNSLECNNEDFIYFTTYPYIQRVSILMCQKEFSSYYHRNKCISYYYLDKTA